MGDEQDDARAAGAAGGQRVTDLQLSVVELAACILQGRRQVAVLPPQHEIRELLLAAFHGRAMGGGRGGQAVGQADASDSRALDAILLMWR